MKNQLDWSTVNQASKMLKAVAHPVRLKMIEALENRHLTVTDLMERLHQSQVTISKHLTILRHSGVVQSRVEGAYRRYSISYPNVLNILHCVRQHSRRGMK